MGLFDKFHPGLGGGALTGGGGYRPRPKPSIKKKTKKEIKKLETSVGGTGSKKMPTKAEIAKLKSTGKVQTSDPKAVRPGKAIKYKESVNPIAKKAAGPGKTKKYTKPTVSGARTKAQEAMIPTSKKLKKMGSRAHIKPKKAMEKALKATSESGRGTYKRFMVK